MKDLVILVADKTMEFTLRGGLSRHQSLGVRPVSFDVRQHPNRDGGSRTSGVQILSLERARFSHALLVFDHEGSGTERSAVDLEATLDSALAETWGDAGKAIVIDPELDVWAWGTDNRLAEVLGWPLGQPIREWLASRGFEIRHDGKPVRPKEALEAVFPVCGLPRSAANYRRIAERISLARCVDPAFGRLKDTLARWFSPR